MCFLFFSKKTVGRGLSSSHITNSEPTYHRDFLLLHTSCALMSRRPNTVHGIKSYGTPRLSRVDHRFGPSQWETVLLCKDIPHWRGHADDDTWSMRCLTNRIWSHKWIPISNQSRQNIVFFSHPNPNKVIIKFCTGHDSISVVACAEFCSNLMSRYGIIAMIIFHLNGFFASKIIR